MSEPDGASVAHGWAPGGEQFTVKVEEEGGSFIPDAASDFPPGSDGSAMPHEVPESFMEKLHSLDKGFTLAWQPHLGYAVIWKMSSKNEWGVVYMLKNPWTDEPLGYDDRVLALLWASDPARFSSIKEMVRSIREEWVQDELRKAKEEREKEDYIEAEVKQFTKIKTGYGYSKGSKSVEADEGKPTIDGNPLE